MRYTKVITNYINVLSFGLFITASVSIAAPIDLKTKHAGYLVSNELNELFGSAQRPLVAGVFLN